MNMHRNIYELGCLVQLKTSIWGGRVKLPSSVIEGADPAFITASKYLVDRDCLKPIEQIRNTARSYLYDKSLPFPIDGVLFIPKDMIAEVDNRFKELQTAFHAEIVEFASMYSTFQGQAKEKLKELYNPADYPQDIRDNEALRQKIANDIGEVRNVMIDSLIARPTRKLKVA